MGEIGNPRHCKPLGPLILLERLVNGCAGTQEWFRWWITEIAVTNRRVIYKKGFIRRRTNEMNMDKVESVQVDLGRMLDYGNVTILGTGEGFETLRTRLLTGRQIAGPA
jgi:hypothetical protein